MKTYHLYYSHTYFTGLFIFFLQKQNDIHSFKLIAYIKINIAKKKLLQLMSKKHFSIFNQLYIVRFVLFFELYRYLFVLFIL